MKKFLLLLISTFLVLSADAQTTYTWVGATGGSWAVSTNWSPTRTTPAATDIIQFNDGATYTVTAVPTQTIRQLLISNNSNITLQSSSANQTLSINGLTATNNLSVAGGSTLTLGSATATFTLNFITTTGQLGSIAGALNVNTGNAFTTNTTTTAVTVAGTIQNNGGTITGSTTTLTFGSGATYIHAMNGGSVPTATWNAASNCNITGITSTAPTAFAGTFGNITWNCAGQTLNTAGFTAASTVAGSLSVLAGTLNDGGFVITGNTTGTFSVANGATYRTTRTATSWLPTAFTTINFNTTGGFEYAGATLHTLPTTPTTYGSLIISGAVAKTLSAPITINGNLAINTSGATLADGGFQITGNSTGTVTMVAGALLTLGTTASATQFPLNYTNTNITLAPTSTVTYNSNVAQTVSAVPTYGNLTMTATGAVTKTFAANTIIQGTLTNGVNNTLDFAGYTISIAGATPISNAGVLNASASTSTLRFNGSVAQTFTLGGTYTGSLISNLIIDNSFSTTGVTMGTTNINVGNLTVNASRFFTLGGFNINIKNNLQNDGTLTSTTVGSTITMNGTLAQTIDGAGVWTTGTAGRLLNLVINNAAGVTLNSTFAIQTGLTLTAGVLTSTTLTIGVPATAVTTTRTAGSLANVPSWGYTTGAYAITYNGGAAINTGNELPPSSTPTNGVLTVTTAGTNVTLQADANIGTLTTSIATTTTFNINGKNLGLSLATPVSNTGVIDASASTSTLRFNGSVAQTFTLGGTYTGSLISNLIIDNSFSTTGVTLGTTNINVGNLTVNASRFFTLGGFNINVKNNLQNNGTLTSTTVGSTITMNGTLAQTIDGAGVWTTGTAGRLLNLVINNAAGVTLNSTFAIQTGLTLTAGVLTSTTLTIGVPATAVTTTRTSGSLANVPSWGYTTGAYAITYNGGAAINTGNELPPSSTPTNGVLTVTTAGTNVTLQADANIGTLTTSVATTTTFNVNGYTLGLSLNTAISNTGVLTANAATSTLLLNGTGAQTLSIAGTLTGLAVGNLTINNAAGVNLTTALTVNNNLFLQAGVFTVTGVALTAKGTLVSGGTGTLTSSAATLVLNSSVNGSMGTLTLTGTGQTLTAFTMNGTGTTPSVNIVGNITTASYTLTSGIVNMGTSSFIYTGAAAGMPSTAGNVNSYFSFLGSASGFQWNMPASTIAGTYRWPIGPAGAVNGFRPVTLKTNAANPASVSNVKIGFINHDGSATYSPTNVVTPGSPANIRANYIVNITVAGGGIPTAPDITMSYQNADFNTTPSAASAVTIYRHNGTWTSLGTQTSNSTADGNITITKAAALALPIGTYPLIPAEIITDASTATTYWAGTTSTDWNTASNWVPTTVPNSTTVNVSITNTSAPFQPVLATAVSVNDITVGTGCTLTANTGANLSIYGNFTNTGTVTPAGTSTFTYAGAGSQTIVPINYVNLTSSGVGARVFSPTGTIGISSVFTPGTNTYTSTGSTVTFNGTAAQNIPTAATISYNNLNVSSTVSNTISGSGSLTVNGNLNITTPTFSDNALQIIGNAAGTLTQSSTSTLQLGIASATITSFPTNFVPANVTLNGTVNYNTITNGQTVAAVTYNNLIITGTTGTKTLAGDATVNGNLTINTTAILADAGYALTIKGSITNNGTHSGTGSITISGGSGAHTIGGATSAFGNLVINDAGFATTISGTGATTVGNLTVTAGVLTVGSFTTSLTISGATSVTGSIVFNGATGSRSMGNVTVNSGGSFTFTSSPGTVTLGDLIVSTGGTWNGTNVGTSFSISGNISNSGSFTSGSALYTVNGANKTINGTLTITNFSCASSNTYTNLGNFTILSTFSGGTFTNGAGATLNLSVAPVGTLVATAVPNLVRYFGATNLTIKSTTYHNLQIDMNTGATTATVSTTAITVNNNLSVTGGTLIDGGLQIVGSATGTFSVSNGATIQYGAVIAAATTSNFPTNYTTANTTLGASSTTIYNTTSAVTVSATPSVYGSLTLSGNSIKTAGSAEIIQGNLTLNGGTFADGGNIITVNGNITNAATINGAGRILLTGGSANHTLAGIGSYVNIELNDALGATFTGTSPSISGTLTQTAGTLSLSAGTNLTFSGSLAATGSGDFGGTTTSGLNITGTGPLGNTLRFNASAQNLSNLTLNRTSSGTVTLGSDINLNAASANGITLTAGLLYLGNYNATLNTTTTMSLGSATAMVVADGALGTGELRKIFAAGTTSFTFAIGDATGTAEYSPVNLNSFTATGGTKTIGIKVTDAIHPQMNSNGAQTNYITRYFSFSESGPATSYTYASTSYISYSTVVGADIVGTLSTATAQLNRYDNGSSTWFQMNSTAGTGQYLTASLFTDVSGKLGGNDFTVRFNPPQSYTWVGTDGLGGSGLSGDWNTGSNWSPPRNTPFATDILQVTLGGTPTIINVPTQTISRLIVGTSVLNTDATFTSTGAQILTINNTTGTNFDIQAGSTLRLSSTGANSTTIAFAGTNVTNIAGTLELNPNTAQTNTINFTNVLAANNIITGTINNNGGVVTSTAAQTTFGAGSFYNHARNGGVVPLATWNATSTCNITGITTTAITPSFSGVFGNLIWNCPSQSVASPLLAASTIAGNLTVTAGTFSDGSTQITGNAAGAVNVASGATLQIGTGGTGTTFPTLYPVGNITLASGSTVIYGSSVAQNVAGLTYHNLTMQLAGTKTAVGAMTVNGNLAITGCQFADGGFQITGNSTGTLNLSASASSILQLGSAASATVFPTNFTAANILIGTGSTVRYNSSLAQNVSSLPTYSILSIAGASTKTLLGNTAVTGATGMLTIAASNTLNLGGNNLTLTNVGGTSPISNSGTISAGTDGGSTITIAGTGAVTLTAGAILATARPNLVLANTSGVTQGGSFDVYDFTINPSVTYTIPASGVLGVVGNYTNNGTLTANFSGSTIALKGTSPQTFTVGTYTGSTIGSGVLATSGGLIINNGSGVTLNSSLNVAVLTLTNGILNCTSANFVTVVGTGAACVNLGTSTSFVNGPLVRSLPASLVAGSTYSFPVGKSAYNLFELINPTTTLATTVRLEVFDAAAGGTDGIGFSSSPSPNKYWQATVLSGALTASGTIRLVDAVNVPTASSIIGNSATVTGTYNPIGGSNAGNFISSTAPTPVSLGFFKIGSVGCLGNNLTPTTYTIAPSGADFTSITSAVSTLNSSFVCGHIIFELQPTYVGTSGETFPITINAANYTGGPWDITIRPSASVSSNLTTSGSSATQLFSLNGIDRLTLDGRPGGTGSTIRWVIGNTSTAGQTVLFNNDATSNTLQYLQVEGVNTTVPGTGAYTNAGIIAFGNTAPVVGNENNVIDNCFIKDGAANPINAIYSFGSVTTNLGNDNISVTNNRLANVWAAATSTSFINLQLGNSTWTINGNSFYQTASRTGTTGTSTHSIILISNTSGNGFTINNNFIGGTAASAGSTAWTQGGIADGRFNGITLSVGSTTASNVQGNTIGNISWAGNGTGTTTSSLFHAIYVTNGLVNIGSSTANIIGNATYPITITFNNTTISQAGTAYGIYNSSPNGQINIQNNTISSITGTISSNTSLNFSAIVFGQGTGSAPSRIINGNTISNITIAGNSGSAGTAYLYGIAYASGSSAAGEIKNNSITSLTNNYSGTAASQVVGIQVPTTSNAFTITGNTISGLSSAATHTSTNASAAAIGISYVSSISSGHTISNNTIHTLSATATAVASNVIGIYYSPALSGTGNSIDGNLIHSLALSTSSATGSINGIIINQGTTTVSNNMIRLGINAAGSNLTVGYAINGINELSANPNNFYSNSVYIGGAGVASSSATYALLSASTGTRSIQNNIFFNARNNTSGAGKNYAIRYATNTGLTCNYNDLLANGSGGVLGNIGGTDNTSLSTLSANSISSDPAFVNATGNATNVDLHIQVPPVATPIEGVGIATPATIDYDGETRSSFTPEDIGADAGNFAAVDQTAPVITVGTVIAPCNSATSLSFTATITDAQSLVNNNIGKRSRVYFKKSTQTNDVSGWQSYQTTSTSNPYSFTINFAAVGGLNPGEILQYFVVAQDSGAAVTTPNVAISSGTFAATPTSVVLTSAAYPIGGPIATVTMLPCQGVISVGTTGTDNYTSLTNTGGIFDAINAATLTGNLTVNITSDLTAETGTVALNAWTESGVGGYTVTFQADGTTKRNIIGSYSGASAAVSGLVRLNGADRVTFNGGTGTDTLLLFRNTGLNNYNATMALLNDASNNTINNCVIQGSSTTTAAVGVVYIGSATTTGNDNNTISNCYIRNRSDVSSSPANGIYADGASASATNNNIVVNNNRIFNNYFAAGGKTAGIWISNFNSGWQITNNDIYQTSTRTSTAISEYYGIRIDQATANTAITGNGFTITGNKIGGSGRDGSGNITGNFTDNGTTVANRFWGIAVLTTGTTAATSIQGNQISNIVLNSTSTANLTGYDGGMFSGIYVNGSGNVNIGDLTANTIGSASTTNNITATLYTNTGSASAGIGFGASATGTYNIKNNTIAGITPTANSSSNAYSFAGIFLNAATGTIAVDNNTIGSTSVANSINCAAGADAQSLFGIRSAATSAVTITNNTIANLRDNGGSTSASTGQAIGIQVTGGAATYAITNNTIRNITNESFQSNGTNAQNVVGISFAGTATNNVNISQNTIWGLGNPTTSQPVSITGIYYGGATSTTNIISRNFIHSFDFVSTSNTANNFGIFIDGTAGGSFQNNMIRLGIKSDGTTVPNSTIITGIADNSTTGNLIYFNSVYIGGASGSIQTGNTYAFRSLQAGADNIRNNIFANNRTGGSSSSIHFAFAATTGSGFAAIDNNIYFASSASKVYSINGGTSAVTGVTQLHAIRSTGFNLRSAIASNINLINFKTPDGTSSTVNLNLNNNTSAASAATPIASITLDINGTVRSGTAPAIGADEESTFVALASNPSYDIFTPVITVSAVGSQAPCGGSLSIPITATVTDVGAGVATGGLQPMLWWRLSTGTWASLAPSSSSGSTYNYTLNISSVLPSQTYQYYVAAQDQATTANIFYSHFDANSPLHADVAATPSPTNNAFASFTTIATTPLSGTIIVGGTIGSEILGTNFFNTLTGGTANDLFYAITTRGLSGDLNVLIRGNTTENGSITLPQWSEYCGSGYKVKISPETASLKTLSGSLIGMGLFGISGADRVTIDGRYNGTGTTRYLKFTNTYASSGGSENDVFKIDGSATNDTIRYCDIDGASTKTSGGVVYLASSCSNIVLENNLIHGNSSNWAVNCILADGASNITIKDNEIYNFMAWGGGNTTRAYGIRVNSGNGSNWNITGNSIYNTGINGNSVQTALGFEPGASSTTNTISNNWIGGSSAQCGTGGSVTYWGNSYTPNNATETVLYGMIINAGTVTINANNISNIYASGCDYIGIRVIEINGSTIATVTNNVLGTGTGSTPDGTKTIKCNGGACTTYGVPGYIYGIWNKSTTTSMSTYTGNYFYYLWQSGAGVGGSVYCIQHSTAGPATITGNIINGPQAAGMGWNSFGVRVEPTTSSSGNDISRNQIAGPYVNVTSSLAYQTYNFGIRVLVPGTSTVSGTIDRNIVWDMRNADYGGFGVTEGIYVYSTTGGNGNWNITNNQVTLKNNGSTANCVGLYGIEVDLNSASTTKVQYNTVYISGSNGGAALASADFSSYAFFRQPNNAGNVVGDAVTLQNNIFVNYRLVSSTAVTGHFAIANNGTSNFATNFNVSDYNFLAVANGSKSFLGQWGTATQAALSNWRTASGKDANSFTSTYTSGASNFASGTLNADNLFVNPLSDVHISTTDGQSYQFVGDRGTPISLTTDFDNETRSSTPDIGMDEFAACSITVNTISSAQSICSGATPATLGGSVTTVPGSPTFQWESSTTSGSTGFSPIGGATLQTYSPGALTQTTWFRRVVTVAACTNTSTAIQITVTPAAAITAYSPVSFVNTICEGSSTSFGVTASDATTYQWQVSTNGGASYSNITNGSPYSGTTTATLAISNTPVGLNGYLYRVIVGNGVCADVTSSAGTLNVSPNAAITTQPATSTTTCEGGSPTITVVGTATSYQWQVSTDGGTSYTNVSGGTYSGGTTATLTINSATTGMTGYKYKVVLSSLCNPVTSSVSTLTVSPNPTISAGGDQGICYTGGTITGASGLNYNTIIWTTSGTGTFSNANALTTGYTPSAGDIGAGTVTLTITASGNGGCSSVTDTKDVTILSANTWVGSTSTDWFNGANWCLNGAIPTATTNVTIPNSALTDFDPLVNGVGATCGSILINSNGIIGIAGTNNLDVNGDWNNSGTFDYNTSTVTFKGSTNRSIAGLTDPQQFYNINVNKGTSTSSILDIGVNTAVLGSLQPTNGLIKLGGSDLTLSAATTIASTAGIEVAGGNLVAGALGFTNNGLFKVSSGNADIGSLTNNSGSAFTLTGGVSTVAGNVANTGTTVSNTGGSISVNGNWTNASSSTVTYGGSTISVTGDYTSTASAVNANSASVSIGGSYTNTSASTLSLGGAIVSVGKYLTMASSTLNQSAGTITLNTLGGSYGTAVLNVDAASSVNLSTGTMVFERANGGAGNDVVLLAGGGTKTITGGTFQFGNSNTTTGQVFKVNNTAVDFNNVTIDNTSGNMPTLKLLANAATRSAGVLTVNGVLDLNQNVFTVKNNANTAISRTAPGYVLTESQNGASRLLWNLGGTTGTNYVFPLGNAAGSYMPLTMYLNSGDIGTAGISSFKSVGVSSGNWPTGTEAVTNVANPSQAIQRFWHLETTASPSSYNVDVTFSFDNPEDPTIGISSVVKMQRYNKPTNAWDAALANQVFTNSTVRTVMVPGITKFSWWGGGNDDSNNNPLPIELTNFKATCNGNTVHIDWSTATETNNDYFTVQRSTDLVTFDDIAVVDGAGNTNSTRNYIALDQYPLSGMAYYRLMQTDFNGQTETFSPTVVVCNDKPVNALNIFPNPANDVLHVNINLAFEDHGTLTVYNHLGQVVSSRIINADKGFNNYTLDVSGYAAGQYFVSVNFATNVLQVQKLVITK